MAPDLITSQLPVAIQQDDLETVKSIIEQLPDRPDKPDKPDKQRALDFGLCYSCRDGAPKMWRFFVSQGADVNFFPPRGKKSKRKTEDRGNHPAIFHAVKKGVMNGNTEMLDFLVASGASLKTQNYIGLTPLMAALKMGADEKVWQALLEYDAGVVDDVDGHGTTALMIAAATRNAPAVEELIKKKAVVGIKDGDTRNALHYLASNGRLPSQDYEKASEDFNAAKSILRVLFSCGVDAKAVDSWGRSCLHWATASRDASLASGILDTFTVDLDVKDLSFKTALHLAAAENDAVAANVLLKHGADVNADAAGGWTPLHLACALKGSITLVKALCEQPADSKAKLYCHDPDLGARTHTLRTALHIAARAGDPEVIEYLLSKSSAQRTIQDAVGDTPLLCALDDPRPKMREKAMRHFAPWSDLSPIEGTEKEAAEKFSATIVDFSVSRNGHVKPSSRKLSVFDLIYKSRSTDSRYPDQSVLPKKKDANNNSQNETTKGTSHQDSIASRFRWIHLPANDVSWCLDILTKHFIESEGCNPERFKELSRSFNNQREGTQPHSRYMTPTCKSVRRPAASKPHFANGIDDVRRRVSSVSCPTLPSQTSNTKGSKAKVAPSLSEKPSSDVRGAQDRIFAGTVVPPERSFARPSVLQQQPILSQSRSHPSVPRTGTGTGGLYVFMPFLHQEYSPNMASLRLALDCAANVLQDESKCKCKSNPWHTLIRAHLSGSIPSLHIRRTLDQFFYQNMDTTEMDQDQVVQKYQTERSSSRMGPQQMLVVDQLWMWVVDENLIVTSFPQQWRPTPSTALSTIEGIMELYSGSALNVVDLAANILFHTTGAYDRLAWTGDVLPPLLMFEGYIGKLMQRKQAVSNSFNDNSKRISVWLESSKHFKDFRKEQLLRTNDPAWTKEDFKDPTSLGRFVGNILNIQDETMLFRELQDVLHELNILTIFLETQKRLLPSFQDAIGELWQQYTPSDSEAGDLSTDSNDSLSWQKRFEEHHKLIDDPLQDIARLQAQVKEMTKSTQDLLELKAKLGNNIETRYAQEQSADNIRQGRTLMAFTIATVIFLPLSFIAAFLAISIKELPHNQVGNQEMPIEFVSRYLFGPGFGAVAAIFIVAFWPYIHDFIRKLFRKQSPSVPQPPKSTSDPLSQIEEASQRAKETQDHRLAQFIHKKPKQQRDIEHGQG